MWTRLRCGIILWTIEEGFWKNCALRGEGQEACTDDIPLHVCRRNRCCCCQVDMWTMRMKWDGTQSDGRCLMSWRARGQQLSSRPLPKPSISASRLNAMTLTACLLPRSPAVAPVLQNTRVIELPSEVTLRRAALGFFHLNPNLCRGALANMWTNHERVGMEYRRCTCKHLTGRSRCCGKTLGSSPATCPRAERAALNAS
jgi:hypothetical protein